MNTQKTSVAYRSFSSASIAEMLAESLASVHAQALASGHSPSGDVPEREVLLDSLRDCSYSMRKRLLKWHFRLQRKCSRRSANRFLHFFCVKLLAYGPDQQVPRIDRSEKEVAIQAARAAWISARDQAEALRLAYVAEKGDYYKP